MVTLALWQKRYWLKLYKEREKWKAKNPGKFYPTRDPTLYEISNYTCNVCLERKWYRTNGSDKDVPQYHQIGKRHLVLCHACWHLKGIYKKHQNPKTFEGLSGCRVCRLQLAEQLARKRSRALPREEYTLDPSRPGQARNGTTDSEPAWVRRSTGLSTRRKRR